ncbi:hypothetical protein BCR35DRAFT_312182 [Leucosporidium creatinivorum]|uniref:Uncharacterized protein n=1 Tax=Leucosporidium creatinivorum TaxID=106004 RepID=A0A1Y2G342_9BASI|nr:hypothetical protein BCR35DRAFT_312182 [Leucosporidium creatinivorum]
MLLRSSRLFGAIRHASTSTKKAPQGGKAGSAPQSAPRALHPPRLPELASLPEATSRLTFHSLPYGSPTSHLFPPFSPHHHTHHTPLFTLRCFPSPRRSPSSSPRPRSPLLSLPTPPPSLEHTTSDGLQPLLTPTELRERLRAMKQGKKSWRMELTLLASKKKVHKSAVVRGRCKRRFREAVRLVVLRGASGGEEGVEIKEEWKEEGARRWLMPGYSYVASIPSLEIYRCPFPELVEAMRTALRTLRTKAINAKLQHDLNLIPQPPPDLTPEELAEKPPTRTVEAAEEVKAG